LQVLYNGLQLHIVPGDSWEVGERAVVNDRSEPSYKWVRLDAISWHTLSLVSSKSALTVPFGGSPVSRQLEPHYPYLGLLSRGGFRSGQVVCLMPVGLSRQ
jgi:hypothetical protein